MVEICERGLCLRFAEGWEALQYDKTDWYCRELKAGLKALDVLATNGEGEHWWVEIKDCEGYEDENFPRLSVEPPPEVGKTKIWLTKNGWRDSVQAVRYKPFVVDEVMSKFNDTLAAIAVAQRNNIRELQGHEVVCDSAPPLSVVLLLTWGIRDFERLAKRLQHKLNQQLRGYAIQGYVVNQQNIQDAGLDCQVFRSEA